MVDSILVQPCGPIVGSIRPPGSKSVTNRALVCAALADGRSRLTGVLDSEDTRLMFEALGQLGIPLALDPAERLITVRGCSGVIPSTGSELQVGNSGTTARFLVALATLAHGTFRIDGTARMRERPIQDLLDALKSLGADVESLDKTGCPPVLVRASGLRGGTTTIAGDSSSQFLSGLLMAAPYAEHPVEIRVQGRLVSEPYVRMTLAVMRSFGVEVQEEQSRRFLVPNGPGYRGREYAIEPDASAASYFFAAAAISGGSVTVEGLSRSSLQGDVAFVEVLRQMGCDVRYGSDSITVTAGQLHGISVDMNPISDTVQTLGAVALFAQGTTVITGVAHARLKETDRLAALATELRKLGGEVVEREDGLIVSPGPLRGAEIATYDDHRMAMSLALVGLRVPGVRILEPGCVAKTYPGYFADLARLTGRK